jgi:translation initiation factor 3 subunit I
MQPIYLTGHSRPVRKVLFNAEGDLLFTCSDDATVVMYHTSDCRRLGVFPIGVACKSIDVSKDSKMLLASSTTEGFLLFDTNGGKQLAKVKVPSLRHSHVSFSFSDQYILVVSEEKGKDGKSTIRVYKTEECLAGNENIEAIHTIMGPPDHQITQASWGPLDETLYISTDKGRMTTYSLAEKKYTQAVQLHENEIFSFTVSFDHVMLISCSKDGTAKLVNPRNFEVIRNFVFKHPCRTASINPLFDDPDQQKFHCILAGGQDAKDVTTTINKEGGFEISLMSMIYNEKLAGIGGHFGTIHTLAFN